MTVDFIFTVAQYCAESVPYYNLLLIYVVRCRHRAKIKQLPITTSNRITN